jgi:hypothetical protein
VRKTLFLALLGLLVFASDAAASRTALKIHPKNQINFGNQPIGSATSRTVTITNVSDEPAIIASFGVSSQTGSFALDFGSITCPRTLAPGESCSYAVTFTPTIAGRQTGSGDICATDICEVFLRLTGRGV